ncbi:hypothetical protein FHR83_000388 [Actinoplanes campanulatus]|uniref:Uncharacterized protein n=1 Tax=Actinoplanes campanulatus TaxID=113559 RepID=A0A7W5FBU9_9ACTN|nr:MULTISPECIES: hypothetical protein [Actinoplanes]MBB3092754.1 hypothetical protein [Actinoplanes campanulatus]GGM98792.1 hypothetical protein GCM10010109_03160 [Actinoplanes campanulatus]GID34149.1 hypothetical protein Aca09nite_06550 [Actinoplanes campanulatus]GID50679.1 hypothetical protein Aca07nite_79540 [Actinoplanes capillaceus]
MSAPGDTLLLVGLAAAAMACAGYVAGRIHQRRQSGAELREAYRHGYETATRSVFSMAARAAGQRPVAPQVVPLAPDVPEQREGRHTVPEGLVRAATYKLPPDRVARAKVTGRRVPRPRG